MSATGAQCPFLPIFPLFFLVFTPGRASRSETAVNSIIPYLAKHCWCMYVAKVLRSKDCRRRYLFTRSALVSSRKSFYRALHFPFPFHPRSIAAPGSIPPSPVLSFLTEEEKEDKEEEEVWLNKDWQRQGVRALVPRHQNIHCRKNRNLLSFWKTFGTAAAPEMKRKRRRQERLRLSDQMGLRSLAWSWSCWISLDRIHDLGG